ISPRDGMEVALIDRDRMAREISITRNAGAELICVTIHWGIEYVLEENASQRSLAGFLADQGVDMIIGSHPHVVQPMEIVHNDTHQKDVLVVYSLGNFISNMKTTDTRGGALVKVRLRRDPDGTPRIADAAYDLIYCAKPTGPGTNFTVIPSQAAPTHVPKAEWGKWLMFQSSASRLFDRRNVGVPYIHTAASTDSISR
ncbi:MAG: CapA family protein, partial [Muribaculaceae bacterium]|nr:CapA family protein [Muribaculaceae bacterium]